MARTSKKSRASKQSRQSIQSKIIKTSGTINKHTPPPIKAISNPKITNPKILEQYNNLYNAKFLGQLERMKQRRRLERERESKQSKLKQQNDYCVIC
jgi:hypothetical protein